MNQSPAALAEWLARQGGSVGLVFTDVVDSTRLLYARETIDYTGMLRAHRTRAAGLIQETHGLLVDQAGDGLLVAFPGAAEAYSFAAQLFRDPGHANLHIRAGVHFGSVSVEGMALVGRSVHLGARVMQHGVGHELWVSDAAKRALDAQAPSTAADIHWLASVECELKGIPDKQRLWRAA